MWSAYMQLLQRRPLPTKIVTSAVLSVISDSTAQYIQHSKLNHSRRSNLSSTIHPEARLEDHTEDTTMPFEWDHQRSMRMAVYAACVSAPLSHGWYRAVDRVLGSGRSVRDALKKVAADQIVIAAPFTCLFFTGNTLLAGGSMQDVQQRLERDFWPTMQANWVGMVFLSLY